MTDIFDDSHDFISRHIGPNAYEQHDMLAALGFKDMTAFIQAAIPDVIRQEHALDLDSPLSEASAEKALMAIASSNKVFKSYIGQGYYDCHTPKVIRRNLFENPAWYTAYTPYQPEISQGRLEALLNFQTMICDLTGLGIANASLLDEATAAAEAMTLCRRMSKAKGNTFFIDADCFPQTLEVLRTRAEPLGYELVTGKPEEARKHDCFGLFIQYPGASGEVQDYTEPDQQGEGVWRTGGNGGRHTQPDAAEISGCNGCRCSHRQHAAFWCPNGLRRTPCGVHGLP